MMEPRRSRQSKGAGERPSNGEEGIGAGPAAGHPIGAAAGEDGAPRVVAASPGKANGAGSKYASPALPAEAHSLVSAPSSEVFGAPDAFEVGGIVDAEALADMQAFNDLKAKRKKQKRRKVITAVAVVVGLIVVLAGAGFWFISDQAARALQDAGVQTAMVEQDTFTQTVSASGNLQPMASVSATPEVEGIVGEVLVSEGDTVAEGQTLFTVVNAELDKAVTQAGQGIEEAKNGVAQAQNAVDDAYRAKSAGQEAMAQAQEAAKAAQAAERAAAKKGTAVPSSSKSVADTPSFDESSADSAIRQAELGLRSANLALQNAQTAYDEAVARADKRTVKASITGSVVAVNIEPGKALGSAAAASASSPVQIADLSKMTVSIGVNEIDILKIGADQLATVTFTAAPGLELPAKVVRIATTSSSAGDGSTPGMSGGAVTYAVKLLIETPDPRLKPGMTAKATIVTQTIEKALMVPISAVQTDGSTTGYVMVLTDPETQEMEMREVEVVASDGLTSVVKGALEAGESVVVSGESLGGMGSYAMGGSAEGKSAGSSSMAASGVAMVG